MGHSSGYGPSYFSSPGTTRRALVPPAHDSQTARPWPCAGALLFPRKDSSFAGCSAPAHRVDFGCAYPPAAATASPVPARLLPAVSWCRTNGRAADRAQQEPAHLGGRLSQLWYLAAGLSPQSAPRHEGITSHRPALSPPLAWQPSPTTRTTYSQLTKHLPAAGSMSARAEATVSGGCSGLP